LVAICADVRPASSEIEFPGTVPSALQLESPQGIEESSSPERCAFGFMIIGDLRFISHHDSLRMFKRALARAGLPVRFSQGFNPQPRISLPLPRPLGVASDDEAIIVTFDQPVDPQEALARLAAQMPQGIRLTWSRRLQRGQSFVPVEVRYCLAVDDVPAEELAERVRKVLGAQTLPIARHHPKYKTPRQVDLRPLIKEMRVVDGGVEFTLPITPGGAARTSEVAELLGFDPKTINHRVRRLQTCYKE